MTWTWKWKTVCHAADPHELRRFTPSAPMRSCARPASFWAIRMTASRSSCGTSSRSVLCSRGITSRCPLVAGLMSMNATVRSSSSTRVDGISPATILQNRQSGSAMGGGYPHDLDARSLERFVPVRVLQLRPRPVVAWAVDLDHEVLFGPVEVDLDPLDARVHARLRLYLREELVLEIGPGPGAPRGIGL